MTWKSIRLESATKHLLPAGTIVLILLLSFWLWRSLLQWEHHYLHAVTEREAVQLQAEVTRSLDATMMMLERMARRWRTVVDTPRDRRGDARILIEEQNPIAGIVLMDAAGVVQWSEPENGSTSRPVAAPHRDLTALEVSGMQEADSAPIRVRLIPVPDGAQVFASVPLFEGHRLVGFLIGAIDSEKLLSTRMQGFGARSFAGTVSLNDWQLFRFGPERTDAKGWPEWSVERTSRIAGTTVRIQLWPTREVTLYSDASVPELALLAGMLVALLAGIAVHLHLSARRHMLAALRAADDLNRFFELTPDPLATFGMDSRIRRINDAFAEGLGYSAGELLDSFAMDLVVPEDRVRAAAALSELNQGVPVKGFLTQLRTKGGEKRWQAWRLVSDPVRQRIYAAARDITEQRQAEQSLREAHEQLEQRVRERTQSLAETVADLEKAIGQRDRLQGEMMASERRYRDLIEGSIQGIFVQREYKVLFANQAYARMHGYETPEQMLALESTLHLFAPHELPRIKEHHEARLRGDPAPEEYEYEGRTRNGDKIWVQIHVRRIEWDGQVASQATLIDRTAHKRAQEELEQQTAVLRASEQRQRHLVNALPHALLIVGADGRISDVNPQTLRMFGYEQTELIGQTVERLLPESLHRGHLEKRTAYLNDPRPRAMGTRPGFSGRRKDGSEFPIEIGLNPEQTQRGLEIICTVIDVTERRQLESQMAASQKMETIGQLAGGVAHDFNNMLAVILSYGKFVLDAVADRESVRDDVQEIITAANRSAALTRQLLAFSRRQVLKLVHADLNAIVVGMEKMLRRLIGEDVQLKTRLAPDIGMVRADVSQMEQVLLNLAVNARDAMPMGGQLTIETAAVKLDEAYVNMHIEVRPGSYVMLSVSDTGTGMDEATQARLFEPFFTTKEQGKGTGLGLSTVYGIVKQLGGSIFVYSELGHGTTFKIYLPRTPQVREAAETQAPPAGDKPVTGTILLVEDERQVRAAAKRILESAGFRVVEAVDGGEALRVAAREAGSIDMLLTDVIMPKMSGAELAAHLTALRPGLEVLYMTGYTEGAITQHGVLKEGVNVVFKPFNEDSLLEQVRRVMGAPSQALAAVSGAHDLAK